MLYNLAEFIDSGKAKKNLSSDDDVENVHESNEKQSIIKPKYATIKTDELERTSSESIHYRRNKKICFGICATIGVIQLIIWLAIWIQFMNDHKDKAWLKKDNYNDDSFDISGNLHRMHVRPRRCTDYEYGCCKIYYSCDISEQDELVSDTMTISPYTIVQHDKHGTNCPRLIDLITGYNNYYLDEEGKCSESEFGCCEINHICDIRKRFDYLNTVNETKKLWLNDLDKQIVRTPLNVAKIDNRGSNCPKIGNIVGKYESGWAQDISGWWVVWAIGIVVLLIARANCK